MPDNTGRKRPRPVDLYEHDDDDDEGDNGPDSYVPQDETEFWRAWYDLVPVTGVDGRREAREAELQFARWMREKREHEEEKELRRDMQIEWIMERRHVERVMLERIDWRLPLWEGENEEEEHQQLEHPPEQEQ
ncbi:hypothetical protein RF55_11824, partial [Lasius niger]